MVFFLPTCCGLNALPALHIFPGTSIVKKTYMLNRPHYYLPVKEIYLWAQKKKGKRAWEPPTSLVSYSQSYPPVTYDFRAALPHLQPTSHS